MATRRIEPPDPSAGSRTQPGRKFATMPLGSPRIARADGAETADDELRKNPLTGLPGEPAFAEEEHTFAWFAAIDIDGVGYMNRTLGTTAGTALVRAAAGAFSILSRRHGNAHIYHLHGDVFVVAAERAEDVYAYLRDANEVLAQLALVLPAATGQCPARGIGFSAGVGRDRPSAERALRGQPSPDEPAQPLSRAARERAGARAPKGQAPLLPVVGPPIPAR